MIKEDFKIERLSAHRVAKRESTPIGIRFSNEERAALKQVADTHGVRTADVIRGALSYVGVIPNAAQPENERTI